MERPRRVRLHVDRGIWKWCLQPQAPSCLTGKSPWAIRPQPTVDDEPAAWPDQGRCVRESGAQIFRHLNQLSLTL